MAQLVGVIPFQHDDVPAKAVCSLGRPSNEACVRIPPAAGLDGFASAI